MTNKAEKELAERFGLPVYEELHSFPLVQGKIAFIPYSFAKQKKVLPLEETEGGLLVAVADPLEVEALAELRLLVKKNDRSHLFSQGSN